jgi:hypothetical protein
MIIWAQIANAVSMISPLVSMLFHRKKNDNLSVHKNKATRLLSIHIPISFCYHLISALNSHFRIRSILKIADLSMIHYYALTVSELFHHKRNVYYKTQLTKISQCVNSLCIIRVCQGHEDTFLRIIGLYICSYNALKDEQGLKEIIIIGSVSSALFYFDDHFNNIGHSLFHILLGLLHHKILLLL